MHIFDFLGHHQIKDLADFRKAIKHRDIHLHANYMEIMGDDKSIFPYMAMFVHGNYAALYFFERQGEAPFSSKAKIPFLSKDDVLFYENSTGAEIFISPESVISSLDAENAAEEFFHSGCRPLCIEWDFL